MLVKALNEWINPFDIDILSVFQVWGPQSLYGLPKFLIEKLQRVQNFSARLITGSYKHDHITPVLKSYTGSSWAKDAI